MPLYAIVCKDKPGALETRLAVRPKHLEYLAQSTNLKLAGALLDDAGSPIGSILVVEADDVSVAQAQADNDPYTAAGIFESVEINPWRLAVGSV
ncbi:YciI family protein [Caulobacter endophyticus]|uniref:YciI family protein n=1 Tax=Caulobacter endophyticus TaxID=2172652 RepID=UPI0024103C61|nr:YciI family protein [Caulobacter endophyticus]MDG2531038.1 YciI family protein [Caulobacter endophyticus]